MGDNKGMDRRGFLKTAAFSSLALGGAAALAGCAPAAGTDIGNELGSLGVHEDLHAITPGDGQLMGMAIGANVSYMDRCWGAPAILTTGDDPATLIAEGAIAQEIAGTDWAIP